MPSCLLSGASLRENEVCAESESERKGIARASWQGSIAVSLHARSRLLRNTHDSNTTRWNFRRRSAKSMARIDECCENVCSLHATPGGHRELGPAAEPSGKKGQSASQSCGTANRKREVSGSSVGPSESRCNSTTVDSQLQPHREMQYPWVAWVSYCRHVIPNRDGGGTRSFSGIRQISRTPSVCVAG